MMLGLILISQVSDTIALKEKEVRDTIRERREETIKFLTGQLILGFTAYPLGVWGFIFSMEGLEEGSETACCAAGLTPITCLGASAFTVPLQPPKKPVAVSSFTGAIDGMIWSSLLIANILAWTEYPSPDLGTLISTIFLGGISVGNAVGYFLGFTGGSEGAYILKTSSALYAPLAYIHTKRIISGNWGTLDSDMVKLDLAASTVLSILGGLGTFYFTYNDYSITGGDALFISSNIIKGALMLDAPIRTTYMISQNCYGSDCFGYVFGYLGGDPFFERLSGFANLTGMALGGYISYKIAKKKDLSLLEGLVYSAVPTLAFWAALPPTAVYEDYIKIAPLFQVAFDVGTSLLLCKIFDLL